MAGPDVTKIASSALSGGAAGSVLGPGGAAAGAGIGIAAGLIGWLIESGYEDEANAILAQARAAYGKLDDSAVQAAAAQVLGPTALGQIKANPRYRAMQDKALAELSSLSRSGLSMSDRASLSDSMAAAGQEARAAQDQVLQSAKARGVGGSGAELAAALQAGQSGANRAATSARQVAGSAADRALQALSQSASLAGSLESTDYNREADAARATDRIAEFNNTATYNRANDAYARQLGTLNRQYGMAQDQAGETRAAGQRAGGMARDVGDLASRAVQGASRTPAPPRTETTTGVSGSGHDYLLDEPSDNEDD